MGYTQATITGRTASLACVTAAETWGRSVAHRACLLTIDVLPAGRRLVADTDIGNLRARALLARLGFERTHRSGRDLHFARSS